MKNQQIYKDEEISLIEKLANGQTYLQSTSANTWSR